MIIQNNKNFIPDCLIEDFNYHLPVEHIAQFPLEQRDLSKMLVVKKDCIINDTFNNLSTYIPEHSLVVFNNTKVLKARLLFNKSTGAVIEIFCLELFDSLLNTNYKTTWICLVKNGKKWKNEILEISNQYNGNKLCVTAKKIEQRKDDYIIELEWKGFNGSFIELLEIIGHTPLPPYINRHDSPSDAIRYQTIFAKQYGSVAAPTAGLHFTNKSYNSLNKKSIYTEEVTLHVGIGTFKPVSAEKIIDHTMHAEHIYVSKTFLVSLLNQIEKGHVIAIGTTTARTLESLYWLGCKINITKTNNIEQWEPYATSLTISAKESIGNLINYLTKNNREYISANTQIIIIPSYSFKIVTGLLTNFHQPKSTLLLLVSAFTSNKWKTIYNHALEHNYRFLSYGDCCLLMHEL